MISCKSTYSILTGCCITAFFLVNCSAEFKKTRYTTNSPKINHPKDNLPTPNRIILGKTLFFDPILSQMGTVSCASCHKPHLAFSDNVSKSIGENGITARNSTPLINLSHRTSFFMDGGAHTLEMTVVSPIEDHTEMGLNILDAAERLKNSPYYTQLSQRAYHREPDPYVITRALSVYIRSLTSYSSRYDLYRAGNKNALNENEIKGMDLFFSEKTMCSSCHNGSNFTDEQFHNVGLYTAYSDLGKSRVTLRPEDLGKFRTPTLREISKTAPYMHDGSMTLRQVLEHYNSGGVEHPNKDSRIKKLHLSDEDLNSLHAFLVSLGSK